MESLKKMDSLDSTTCPPMPDVVEKRLDDRWGSEGNVALYIVGPSPRRFVARLIDCSDTGFRATHTITLLTGQEVCFRHATAAGVARVMWSRTDGRTVENGFYIVETWPLDPV